MQEVLDLIGVEVWIPGCRWWWVDVFLGGGGTRVVDLHATVHTLSDLLARLFSHSVAGVEGIRSIGFRLGLFHVLRGGLLGAADVNHEK